MSAEFDRLIADASVHAPGALPSGIEAELFALLRDFLQATNVWQMAFELSIVRGTRCYTINPGNGVAIKSLLCLFDTEWTGDRRWVAPAAMPTPGTIMLARDPDVDNRCWVAQCSVYAVDGANPSDCKRLIPSWILSMYYDTLFQGLVGRLQIQPMKPYSNAALGAAHLRAYYSGRGLARAAVAIQNVHGAQPWLYAQAGVANTGRQRGV